MRFNRTIGRAAIGEMLLVTAELRKHLDSAHMMDIPKKVLESLYISLKESGDEAVEKGITTDAEIKRYCGDV